MRWINRLAGWILGCAVLLLRLTCRYEVINDPRPALRARKKPYVYSLRHSHQVAAVLVNDERVMAAMVSRSADGDLLAPALRMRRVLAVRGSSRKDGVDKGGRKALTELETVVRDCIPALLAVDGPRGPRNRVHRGVIDLAKNTGATILPTLVIPSRRWILRKTWDRFQIPRPFSTVRLIFGEALEPDPGLPVRTACEQLSRAMDELERRYDPREAPAGPESSRPS